tara:strand:+ start:738 stop:1037 length:300 start_codon:yes stop_codon:yes gene_type:complete
MKGEVMQIQKLHKDIKDLMETNEDLSVFHSGGGCEHLAYKGWLINEEKNGDFDYDITKINLNTFLTFGDYQDDINYFFFATLEEGMKLIEKYNMKGEQY